MVLRLSRILAYLVVMVRIEVCAIMSVLRPIPVAARSKAWVCGRSLDGIAGSKPAGGMDVCLL